MRYRVKTDKGNERVFGGSVYYSEPELMKEMLNGLITKLKRFYAYDEEVFYFIMGLTEEPIAKIPKILTPEHLSLINQCFDLMLTKDDSCEMYRIAEEMFEWDELAVEVTALEDAEE